MTSPPIPLHIIRSHTAALSTAIFNPDNSLLYSADQEGWISVLDLRVRRVVCHWKAHDGGVLGLAEWQGGLISHGRDNHIHIYSPLKRPFLGRDPPLIVKTLDVNSLNFCSFSLTPRSSTTTTEAEGFLAVPSLTDSELADIYHLPSCKRLHAAIGFSPNKDATEEARSGLIMGIHLAWYGSRLVLIMGFEDGRVEVWRCAESGEDQLWDARSGRDPLWAKVWAGKGHNEAVMGLAVDVNLTRAFTVSADHLLCRYDIAKVLDEKGKRRNEAQKQVISTYSTKQIGNSSVAISADGRVVAVGGWDGQIRLFSSATFKPLGTLSYHRETVHTLSFASPLVTPLATPSPLRGDGESVTEAATLEIGGEEDSEDEDGAEEGKERSRWLVSGGKDRRVALWALKDFTA